MTEEQKRIYIWRMNVGTSLRRRISGRGLAAGIAVVASGVVLAGCGVASSIDPVASAATKSQRAGAAHVTFSATITSPQLAGGKALTMTGTGTVANGEGELDFDMSQMLSAAGATGVDGTAKEIFLQENGDYVVYMRMAMLDSFLNGKHWLKIDLSKVEKAMGVDISKLMGNAAAQDPSQMLSLLKASSGAVDNLGSATVGGVDTTHYRATVDLAKSASIQGIDPATVKQLEALGAPSTVPIDVWVGSDGLVRQLEMTMSVDRAGVSEKVAMTMGFTGWGTAVAVTAPPASDVLDATALAAKAAAKAATTP